MRESWRRAGYEAGLLASMLHYASSGGKTGAALAQLCSNRSAAHFSHPFGARSSHSKRETPPESHLRRGKPMALQLARFARAASLRSSLSTYAKVQDRETTVAALRLRGWKDQSPKRDAVAKRFEFASFNEAFGWMSRVALQAEAVDHHPEWTNLYSIVEVTLTTHAVDGLSDRDIQMADFMDHAAARFAPKPFK